MYMIWVLLVIVSLTGIYFAYSLIEDFDIISQIYQSSTNTSVVNYSTLDPSINQVEETNKILYSILGLNICTLLLLSNIFALYMNSKIINNKWSLSYIKKIFGDRFYYYFLKALTFTSKSNEIWMLFAWILLAISSLASIYFAYNLIIHIDIITELHEYSKK